MSTAATGSKIPLAAARAAAQMLTRLFDPGGKIGLAVVGSVRRGRPEVGDLEFIAPHAVGVGDELYANIAPLVGLESAGLMAAQVEPIGRHVSGLKPGFWAASLEVRLRVSAGAQAGREVITGVQVFRYAGRPPAVAAHAGMLKSNKGWIELMRTGPSEFGILFLQKWKTRQGIGPGGKGSREGWLLDADQIEVSTPTEAECFRLCGMPFIEPEQRDEYVRERDRSRRVEDRDQWR